MNDGEAVKIIIGGVVYLLPIFTLVWQLSKAHSEIKTNAREIDNLKKKIEKNDIVPVIQAEVEQLKNEIQIIRKNQDELKSDVYEIKGKIDTLINQTK